MNAYIQGILLLFVMLACSTNKRENAAPQNMTEMEKKNIGNMLALYPKPMTVIGAEADGKANWVVAGNTGIIGHDRVLVSMSKRHCIINQEIRKSKKLSVSLVSREMLRDMDLAGNVSGEYVDDVFDYHFGENRTPVPDKSPLTMECNVEDIYETDGFDNFMCPVINTYADPDVLDKDGRLDYARLRPVLSEFPDSYLAAGEIIGKPQNLDKQPGMCAKLSMSADGIVRLSKVEVYPEYLNEYMIYAAEVGEVSLRTEPGVLTMYAMAGKENPCQITILETYANKEAYDRHISSKHFQKYKQGTLHMVKQLVLSDQLPLNPANQLNNFIR